MELFQISPYLVFSLNRFKSGNKVDDFIECPLTNLDVTNAIASSSNQKKNIVMTYDLVGVINHSGTMHGGHYTANCMNSMNGKWYNYND